MYLLHLETATKICSVALSTNGRCVQVIDVNGDGFVHGEQLTLLIQQVLQKEDISMHVLAGISVGMGPGSYTGLRIGMSTAKALCFALNLPLLGVSSLGSLIEVARASFPKHVICAAFDARRDEVFRRIESPEGNLMKTDGPEILDEHSYTPQDEMIWVGDANEKVKNILKMGKINFQDHIEVSAKGQVKQAYSNFMNKEFLDLASSTPNYAKAFYTTHNI